MRLRVSGLVILALVLLLVTGCNKSSNQQNQPASNQPAQQQQGQEQNAGAPPAAEPSAQPAVEPSKPAAEPAKTKTPVQKATPAPRAEEKPAVAEKPAAPKVTAIPAGTVLTVRLGQSVGSKTSSSGESFIATMAQPVKIEGVVLIPAGAEATGTVAEAAPLGRFKGGAKLSLVLNSITVNGKRYDVKTAGVSREEKGKGKRTGAMVGGGAGLGAVIGGLAGGGKGAAIGALAGAGAGTAGAAYTGNKDIVLPAETALSFKLLEPVEVR
jgi:hypothetical protein